MSQPRTIPADNPTDLPTFTILVGGTQISDAYQVLQIATTKGVNLVATARIAILDGDPSKEDFEISNKDEFIPGSEIEIQAGYHSEEETIFKGVVVRTGLRIDKGGGSVLVVDCKDEAVKMTIGRNSMYYYEKSDSDIIEELIGNHGLTADVEASSVTHPEMVQYYCTDWDFMVSRAEVNGQLVFVSDGTVKVAKPDLSADPALSLLFGATMLEFDAHIDARAQYKGVKGVSWDIADQALLELDGEDPSLKEAGNLKTSDLAGVVGPEAFRLQHSGLVNDQELQAWTDATLMRSRLAKIQGNVTCQGTSVLLPGDVLELGGVGDRFNGNVFIAGVRQEIGNGNWETKIEFGLSPKWFARQYQDINDLPAGGLLPGIPGLHAGVVVALEGDPDGEERIQVRIPTISSSEDGLWARLATLDAGDSRGWVFRPELDDEVIVGFMNGDPRDPVVLGQLHSSAKPSPIPAADDNHEKGLTTRAEMKLTFNDDLVSATLETPKGNTLILSEDDGGITIEDENGNVIKMSSGGIDIESAADINIKASGDVNIEGTNVSIAANANFSAEGNAGASLESGASTVVKGSIVQIN